MFRRRWISGFTLVEALVVVAVLGTVLAMVLPAVGYVRSQALGVACASNLRQIGSATVMYHGDHNGRYWRYYVDESEGRNWWFGFEPGGPSSQTHRPLQKEHGALSAYLTESDAGLLCPEFPYDDADYFEKFAEPAASYGYNMKLGPTNPRMRPASQHQIGGRAGRVVTFADAVHFDFGATFNEGHYMWPTPGANQPSGYAHFRHRGEAQMLMADGSVERQSPQGPLYPRSPGDWPVGNLKSPDGSLSLYEP